MLTIHCTYFQMRESLVSHGADLHVCSASLFVALEKVLLCIYLLSSPIM